MTAAVTVTVLLAGTVDHIPAVGAEAAGAEPTPEEKAFLQASPAEMQWWREARLGMFVCWGPVSLTGLEIGWSRGGERRGVGREGTGPTPVEVYDNLYKKWKPDQFDARQWVQVATDAGAKYMIFLVKHHDGFCLYDSKLTDYKSTGVEAAWKHDVMADIAEACHEAGLKLIVYYSQPDWYHPDYRTENHDRYNKYFHGQIRELLTNYGRVDGLWFDLGGKPEDWDSHRLFKMIRTLQPGALINNRCGLPGDFDTPEQCIGRFQTDRPWESCITLGHQWSWRPNDKIKSLKQCIDILVRCTGGDGNLALNTNPMPDGRIEPRQAERFREIGQWLKKHGESIYATRGGPFQPRPWGACTYKENRIYIHILDWDWVDDEVTLPPVDKQIIGSSVLTGGAVSVKQSANGIVLSVPASARQELDTIVVLELEGLAGEARLLETDSPLPAGSLAAGEKATASSVWRDNPKFGPQQVVDNDHTTHWIAKEEDKEPWLEVDLGESVTVGRAIISEPAGFIRSYQLQHKDGEEWKTFFKGRKIGELNILKFAPITARFVRLQIKLVRHGSARLNEFQVFGPKELPAK